jgi:hypothetical protein
MKISPPATTTATASAISGTAHSTRASVSDRLGAAGSADSVRSLGPVSAADLGSRAGPAAARGSRLPPRMRRPAGCDPGRVGLGRSGKSIA